MFKQARACLFKLVFIAGVFAIGMIVPADATTSYAYSFSFQGSGVFGTTGNVTANGIFTIQGLDSTQSLNTPPGFDITGITGTYDGFAISALVDPATCAGSALCNALNPLPNNILYIPGSIGAGLSTPSFLDAGGVLFSDANGDVVNLAFGTTDYFAASCNGSCADFDVSFFEGPLEVTPLPGSLPLLGTALLGSYLLAHRRKRRNYRPAAI